MTKEEVLMGSTAIIAAIDKELARLHGVRAVLLKKEKQTKKANSSAPAGGAKKGKRQLSAAGRARIAAAQRKRWAAVRKEKKKT